MSPALDADGDRAGGAARRRHPDLVERVAGRIGDGRLRVVIEFERARRVHRAQPMYTSRSMRIEYRGSPMGTECGSERHAPN
jgi:hypothetical protein